MNACVRCSISAKRWLPKLDAELHERVTAGGVAREPKVDCVRYLLPGGKTLEHAPEVELLRHPDGAWRTEQHHDQAQVVQLLAHAALALPEDSLAIAVQPRGVSVCWTEPAHAEAATVEAIFNVLADLKTVVGEHLGGS